MNNPHKLITENLNIWTAAIKKRGSQGRGSSKKIELHGIKKLRELILELAVRGLLVPQDPNDEPASVLLEKIAAEKAQLIKDKKIKKQKPMPEISEDEKPFELPKGWKWARLAEVGHDWGQKKPEDDFTYIDVGAINKELGFIEEPSVVGAAEAPSRARKLVKKGTVIYSTVRPYLLNIAVVDREIIPEPIASTAFAILHPYKGISSSFLYRYLRSPSFVAYVESCQSGIAYPAINDKQFFSGICSIPPEAEQPRIVAKVDELMALCDQLEQQTEASLTAHQTLVETLLNSLLDAAQTYPGHASSLSDHAANDENKTNSDPFQHAWQRIWEHFDVLFTTEHSIDQLKQTILQLAVMGKLVPQNENDEPANVLLEKIAAEKEQLIKDGKIKKQKALPEISEEEKPFALPKGWEWVRLGVLLNKITDGTHHSPPNGEKGDYLYISAKNIKHEGVKLSNATFVTSEVHHEIYSRCNPEQGDILYIKDGATTGIGTINQLTVPFSMLSSVALLKSSGLLMNNYVLNSMRSPFFYEEMRAGMTGVAITRVTLKKLELAYISLPPGDEQPRIVAKVDELMALCDTLKERIRESQTTQLHLADAMADSALGRTTIIKLEEKGVKRTMTISTELSLGSVEYDNSAILAPLISSEGADAKIVWSKSKLELPDFYKQLKLEIKAGFLAMPAKAEFEG